jgi:hypothetical protein
VSGACPGELAGLPVLTTRRGAGFLVEAGLLSPARLFFWAITL